MIGLFVQQSPESNIINMMAHAWDSTKFKWWHTQCMKVMWGLSYFIRLTLVSNQADWALCSGTLLPRKRQLQEEVLKEHRSRTANSRPFFLPMFNTWTQKVLRIQMVSYKYHCRSALILGANTSTGAVVGKTPANLWSSHQTVSVESSIEHTNTFPGCAEWNVKCL